MFGIQNFYLFLISCILLNLTPGQDTIYIVGRSIAQGRKAGILSVFGIMTGVLIHTLLAALGLSVILATSALAFQVVKFIGAGYLIWIGIGLIRNSGQHQEFGPSEEKPLCAWKVFRQGVLTDLFNPKVALFFLSFLPQFVAPQVPHAFLSFMLLGLVFFTTGSLWCLILVFSSAWATHRFRNRPVPGGMLKKVTGGLFVGLGIKLAFSRVG
jgi:threonine/homoserine/homoserine lactone efflux protein